MKFDMFEHEPSLKQCSQFALAFATALVEADFDAAHGFLAADLQQRLPPDELCKSLFDMFDGYAKNKPKSATIDEESGVMMQWRGKLPRDVCWAYASIEGDDFVEAVTLFVAERDGVLRIREIFWGRP